MIWLFLCLLVAVWIWPIFLWNYRTKKNSELLRSFQYLPDLNLFTETKQRIDLGGKKIPRAVLLLHGFSSSTNDFKHLIEKLKQEKIPYLAPNLTGFGLADLHLLKTIQYTDWVRDAVNAHEVLSSIAERVDVVGFSNGGCLAAVLASIRSVGKLILISPYLSFSKGVKIFYWLLMTPIVKYFLFWFLSIGKKPDLPDRSNSVDAMDPAVAKGYFHYSYITPQSIVAVWELQKLVDFSKPLMPKEIYGLFGSHDLLLGTDSKKTFQSGHSKYKIFEYPQSAHLLLDDYEHSQAVEKVIQILKMD